MESSVPLGGDSRYLSASTGLGGRSVRLIHTHTAQGTDSSLCMSFCHLGVISVKDSSHFWLIFFNITFQSIGSLSCSHLFCAKEPVFGFPLQKMGRGGRESSGRCCYCPCVPFVAAILVIEFVYAIVGIVWLTQYYASCNDLTAKSVTLGTYGERGLCVCRHPLASES